MVKINAELNYSKYLLQPRARIIIFFCQIKEEKLQASTNGKCKKEEVWLSNANSNYKIVYNLCYSNSYKYIDLKSRDYKK